MTSKTITTAKENERIKKKSFLNLDKNMNI